MKLKYLSQDTIDRLRADVPVNIERYRATGFRDLMPDSAWSIELDLDVDLAPLADLEPARSAEAEIRNSRLVWRALRGLSPSLAYEEGIWVRLTHVECLEFSRKRWLSDPASPKAVQKDVLTHFFADTLTKRRDDNAICRLWWNAYIARTVSTDDQLDALPVLLKTADIRSNIVERRMTASRAKITAGLVRLMRSEPAVTADEQRFRDFMKAVNKLGGGILFEALTEKQVDSFMQECLRRSASLT